MTKEIKKKADLFIKEHNIENLSYEKLKRAANDIGYTIIEFNSISNDKTVEIIIKNLRLEDIIIRSRGFTYTDSNNRLVFINEDLSEKEKIIILVHELGHIVCKHFSASPIIGNDVNEEYEANEFAHYILNQSVYIKIKQFFINHKKLWICIIAVVILSAATFSTIKIVKKELSYYGDFYITTTGSKYHKKDCIFVKEKNNVERLTKEQFSTSEYSPCEMCLPNK